MKQLHKLHKMTNLFMSELSSSQKDEFIAIINLVEKIYQDKAKDLTDELKRKEEIIEKIKLSLCDSEIGKLIKENALQDIGSDEAMGAMILAGHVRNYINRLTK